MPINVFQQTQNSFHCKAAFELAENLFRKSFSVKPTCLVATENRISEKPFQFDQNLPHLTRKSFYRIILPSNRFRVMCKREREREKERETTRKRDRTSTQHRRRRDRSKSFDEPRKPKTELVRRAMPQSSDREPIPQIVELVRRTQLSDWKPIP